MAATLPETRDFMRDPNISLREKWRMHVEKRKQTGLMSSNPQFLHTWGPRATLFVIVGAGSWELAEAIPAVYAGGWEHWVWPSRFLLMFLLFEVTVNWLLARYVRSTYRPEIHGTQPADFPGEGLEETGSSEARADSAEESNTIPEITTADVTGGTCEKRTNSGDLTNGQNHSKSDSEVVDLDYAPPTKSGLYDGHSYRMLVATSLPSQDGRVERKSVPYWSWVMCVICNKPRPPRCHHCPLCKECILKRDHHCFISGSCVGLNNQRFFHVFVFWAFPLTAFGLLHMVPYALNYLGTEEDGAAIFDLIMPLLLVRTVLGYTSLKILFLCCEFWLLVIFNVSSLAMTIGHSQLLYRGKTSFERDSRIKVSDTRGLKGKLESVFGRYWWVNLFFPLCPWYTPVEDAVLWPHIKPC